MFSPRLRRRRAPRRELGGPGAVALGRRRPRAPRRRRARATASSAASPPSSTSSAVGWRAAARSEPGDRSTPSPPPRAAARRPPRAPRPRGPRRRAPGRRARLHLLQEHLEGLGDRGLGDVSPLTIASYAFTRPIVSSDLIVSISWSVNADPYASSAQTSISPNRWPPNCALPPSGCCDERVRAGRARVDLVVHEVEQLQDVHEADRDVLRELLAGLAVVERHLPEHRLGGRLLVDVHREARSRPILAHASRASSTSSSVAPSKTGVAMSAGRAR